jgi:hypothetical protein
MKSADSEMTGTNSLHCEFCGRVQPTAMKKVGEYRAHADECRQMAKRSHTSAERDMLLNMASTWDSLAASRAAEIARHHRTKERGPRAVLHLPGCYMHPGWRCDMSPYE